MSTKKLSEIERKVLCIIADHFGDEEILLDTDLVKDWSTDDLDILQIVMECEDVFDVKIMDGTFDHVRTPADFAKLVWDQCQPKGPLNVETGCTGTEAADSG